MYYQGDGVTITPWYYLPSYLIDWMKSIFMELSTQQQVQIITLSSVVTDNRSCSDDIIKNCGHSHS